MSYQVIARKCRPQKFCDVVGQKHIIKTLQNELITQRLAHAYLFVGPRGIGKTTIARIFAKALNCAKAPLAEPCGICDSCVAISKGSSLDVIEIDGASNNSVNDIRALRDEVGYAPANSPYKIYIIDEVHMLSQSAWNALLKTVEEPPPHIKFFFATTEAHKVIPTIVSRCQRFDLQRIPVKLIAENLKKIVETEKIRIADSALNAIARAADGGIRDAQSLLDQVISFFSGYENEISETEILEIFGLTATSDMQELIAGMFKNDCLCVINSINSISSRGKNLEKLYEDILLYLRAIEICNIMPRDAENILDTGTENLDFFKKIASQQKLITLQLMLENLTQSGKGLYDALNKQVYLETMVLKAMRNAHATRIEDLIERLQQIREEGDFDPLFKKKTLSNSNQTQSLQYQNQADQNFNPIPQNYNITDSCGIQITGPSQGKNQIPENSQTLTEFVQRDTFRVQRTQNNFADKTETNKKSFDPAELWHQLIQNMDAIKQPILKSIMQEAKPVSLEHKVISVSYDKEYDSEHIQTLLKSKKILEKCLKSMTGIDFSVFIEAVNDAGAHAEKTLDNSNKELSEVRKNLENNQFIKEILQTFEGTIIEVRG